MSKNLSIRHRAEKRFIAYGFISLIFPERIFTLPAIIEAKSLPSFAEGSKIKSSIVNLVNLLLSEVKVDTPCNIL